MFTVLTDSWIRLWKAEPKSWHLLRMFILHCMKPATSLLKIKTICHLRHLWNLARSGKHCVHYARRPRKFTRISMHWVRQYLGNTVLIGIEDRPVNTWNDRTIFVSRRIFRMNSVSERALWCFLFHLGINVSHSTGHSTFCSSTYPGYQQINHTNSALPTLCD